LTTGVPSTRARITVERLDAGDRPGREERHDVAQVEWLPHRQVDDDLSRRGGRLLGPVAAPHRSDAQLRR
jgi:hypothetical protein